MRLPFSPFPFASYRGVLGLLLGVLTASSSIMGASSTHWVDGSFVEVFSSRFVQTVTQIDQPCVYVKISPFRSSNHNRSSSAHKSWLLKKSAFIHSPSSGVETETFSLLTDCSNEPKDLKTAWEWTCRSNDTAMIPLPNKSLTYRFLVERKHENAVIVTKSDNTSAYGWARKADEYQQYMDWYMDMFKSLNYTSGYKTMSRSFTNRICPKEHDEE